MSTTIETTPQQRGERLIKLLGKADPLLRFDQLKLYQSGNGTKLTVTDPATSGGKRTGDVFVSQPMEMIKLMVDSQLSPRQLLEALEKEDVGGELAGRLINHQYDGTLALDHQEDNFHLQVFGGTANAQSLILSEKAVSAGDIIEKLKSGTLTDDERQKLEKQLIEEKKAYQKALMEIMEPIYRLDTGSAQDAVQEKQLVIQEDCIASADSITAVLKYLAETQSSLINDRKIRINVAVTTAQAVLVLRKFAKDNSIDLDIRAGYLGWGLTGGQQSDRSDVRIHANYIYWTGEAIDEIADQESQAKMQNLQQQHSQVPQVGDMGDMVEDLPEESNETCPWNTGRKELREQLEKGELSDWLVLNAKRVWSADTLDGESIGYGTLLEKLYELTGKEDNKTIFLLLANGGYGMEALYRYIVSQQQSDQSS